MELIEIFKVTVNHFRGYREKKDFDFGNGEEVILLSGPNGYGKTSVFDAIEWGFTGKLSRFEEPNEEKNNSCFINFQPYEGNAEVHIEFGDDKNIYCLDRKSIYMISDSTDYNYKKSTLCISGNNIETLYNTEAMNFLDRLLIKEEWQGKIGFTDIFSRYHVLTQDKIKKFIQGIKGPDRYKQIAMMVGTQRFYKYKNFFEQYAKICKDNEKKYSNEKAKIEIELKAIKEVINDDIKINFGNADNINEWINDLVNRYNIIISNLKIEKYTTNEEMNLLDKLIDLKNNVIQAKEKLKLLKKNDVFVKENLSDIRYQMEEYLDYKYKYKLYSDAMPILEKKNKLIRLKNQLPILTEYNDFIKNNKIKILEVSNLLKEIKIYLLEFTNMHNQIEFILNELNKEKKEEDSLEKHLIKNIDIVKNNIPKFQDINEILLENKEVSFLEYKQHTDIHIEKPMNINNFIEENINLYENNLKNILSNSSGYENKICEIQKCIFDLNNDIKKISILEDEIKNILTESLTYIENENPDNYGKIKCPVCDNYLEKDKFISNIKNKLISDNKELLIKINSKTELEKKLKEYNEQLIKFNDEYKNINRKFIEKIMLIENAIVLLGQAIRKQEKKYEAKFNNLNEDEGKMQEKYSSVLNLMKSLDLSFDNKNEIEKDIEEYLKNINEKLNKENSGLNLLAIEDIRDITKQYQQKILRFEGKTKQFNINLDNIKNDVEYKLKKVDDEIIELDNYKNNLETLEENFTDAYKKLSNSEKMKKIKQLEESYNKCCTEEEQNKNSKNILEKLASDSAEAIQEISQDILSQHEEFINSIYKRINPHPLFTEIEFKFDKNNKGKDILNIFCKNKNLNNKVNPAFTFSSAQVNVVAVSIFLGMALRQRCSNLKTIMLDDPIQNMDDLNIISFIDILRNCLSINENYNNKKQIIISTHDEDIYKMMIKKFRFVKNKSFEFIGYDDKGPQII